MLAQTPPSAILSSELSQSIQDHSSPICSLVWQDRQLFIQAHRDPEGFEISGLQDNDRLVECLKRSPVEAVNLDLQLNAEIVLWWADACQQAEKDCYVRSSAAPKALTINDSHSLIHESSLSTSPLQENWLHLQFNRLQRTLHRGVAVLVTTLLMPFWITQMPNFRWRRHWAINPEGKILQILTLGSGTSSQSIEIINRLINVVRGAMLLNEPMPQAIATSLQG